VQRDAALIAGRCEDLRKEEEKYPDRLVHFGPKMLSDRKRICVAEEPGEEYKTKPNP
jgi:hypothetical protein